MGKIKFLVSCISGTTTNSGNDDKARPCIAYFIVYDKKITNEDEIFSIFHDNDLDVDIKKIGKGNASSSRDELLKELVLTLKVSASYFSLII